MSLEHPDDALLVEPEGPPPWSPSAEAATDLFREQGPRLRGLVRRILRDDQDADEILQEAFLRMLARTEPLDAPAAWLHAVARNLARDRLRGLRPRDEDEDAVAGLPDTASPPTDAGADLAEARVAVLVAASRLTPTEHLVVVLRDLLDHDVAETAAALETSPATVKVLHGRARRRMAELDPGDRELDERVFDAWDRFAQWLVARHVLAASGAGRWTAGDLERQRELLVGLVDVARSSGRHAAVARSLAALGRLDGLLGRFAEAEAHLRVAAAEAREARETRLERQILRSLVRTEAVRLPPGELLPLVERGLRLARGEERLSFLVDRHLALVDLGRVDEGEATLREIAALVAGSEDAPTRLDALNATGLAAYRAGRYEEAASAWLEAHHLAEAVGAPWFEARAAVNLALIAWRRGDAEEAEAWLARADERARASGHASVSLVVALHRGTFLCYRRRFEEARVWLAAAKGLAGELGHRRALRAVDFHLVQAAARLGRFEEVLELARDLDRPMLLSRQVDVIEVHAAYALAALGRNDEALRRAEGLSSPEAGAAASVLVDLAPTADSLQALAEADPRIDALIRAI